MPTVKAAVPASGAGSAVHGVSANVRVLKRVRQEWFGGHVPGYGPAAMNPQQKSTPGDLYFFMRRSKRPNWQPKTCAVCPSWDLTILGHFFRQIGTFFDTVYFSGLTEKMSQFGEIVELFPHS
jgi:hypothetical protein